ncbi:P-loop containing nucleoside triphosphate hydrolase protein [Mrakia frigida]|uniref:P-loop containing nucleoside triphosphate hydrolase protein n=1 Tax=Mrakia frigida TaxID=29902 RepID=UPI003FCBFF3E
MDDFVLNIAPSTGGGGAKSVPKQKGGRWQDRAKANKNAKRGPQEKKPAARPTPMPAPRATPSSSASTSKPPPPPRQTPSASSSARPSSSAKKFKFEEDKEEYDEDTYEDRASSSKAAPPSSSKAAAAAAAGTKQIISSLFTSNPHSSSNINDEDSTPTTNTQLTSLLPASNAPLTSSSDNSTFPGLGLDPLLTHHLSTKLSITHPTPIQRASLPFLLNPPQGLSGDRDVFIQSQTGSGKTLTYLLPIIQSLLPLSGLSYIDRSIGTLAIILVPTRELAKQISDVLESLLNLHLSLPSETNNADPSSSSSSAVDPPRRTRWIVPGLLTGGSTRAHEKARIRKGLPILVSTPGRLLDHLQNTASFDVGKCRWLVLDEADRLMDLGFEETVTGILKGLDGRRKLALEAIRSGENAGGVGGWDWSVERKTVLCSATVREDVQKLAGTALRRPVVFRATDVKGTAGQDAQTPKLVPIVKKDASTKTTSTTTEDSTVVATTIGTNLEDVVQEEEEKFTPPSQLSQKHIVVPPKLRLVTLVALLRSLLSNKNSSPSTAKEGRKVIVFLSTTDAVDFHWKMLGGVGMGGGKDEGEGGDDDEDEDASDEERAGEESADEDVEMGGEGDSDEEEIKAMIKAAARSSAATGAATSANATVPAVVDPKKSKKTKPKSAAQKAAQLIKDEPISYTSTLLPNTTIHRLHGSLPLQTRLASLKAFSTNTTPPHTDLTKPAPGPSSSILFCTSVASRGLDMPLVRAVVQYDLPTEGGATEYVHRVGRTARVGRGGEAWSFVGTGPEKEWVGWIESKMGEGTKVGGVGVEGVLKKGFGGEDWEGRATEVQGAFERWVLSKTKVSFFPFFSFPCIIFVPYSFCSSSSHLFVELFRRVLFPQKTDSFSLPSFPFLPPRTPTSPKKRSNPTSDPTQPTRSKKNVSSTSRTSISATSPKRSRCETLPPPCRPPLRNARSPTLLDRLDPSGSSTTTRARWMPRRGCRRR